MPTWEKAVSECKHCGTKRQFTSSLRELSWELALTWNDKKFLRARGISPL